MFHKIFFRRAPVNWKILEMYLTSCWICNQNWKKFSLEYLWRGNWKLLRCSEESQATWNLLQGTQSFIGMWKYISNHSWPYVRINWEMSQLYMKVGFIYEWLTVGIKLPVNWTLKINWTLLFLQYLCLNQRELFYIRKRAVADTIIVEI